MMIDLISRLVLSSEGRLLLILLKANVRMNQNGGA
jgi:hypothetical protein